MTRSIYGVDLFAGAGGFSTGFMRAMLKMDREVHLCAINHWAEAVAAHAANWPMAEHRCERVEAVDRTTVHPGKQIDVLIASPECVEWSKAKGGKPKNDQRRAGAWYVLDWIADRQPRAVMIENVPELVKWGKLDTKGKQVKQTEGEIFKAYIAAIRASGYNVGYKVLDAADYGAVTSRKRLFILARRGRQPVHFPIATHSKGAKVQGTKPWRGAREIIDRALPSRSIFNREKPLARRTLARIAKGIRRLPDGQLLEPLARAVEAGEGPIPVKALVTEAGLPPLPDLTLGQHGGAIARPTDDPMATIAAGGALSFVRAIIKAGHGLVLSTDHAATNRGSAHDLSQPVPTIVGSVERVAFVDPMVFGVRGRRYHRSTDLDAPMPSLTTCEEFVLADAMILPPQGINGGPGANPAQPAASPLPTITQRGGEMKLVQPLCLIPHHGERPGQDLRTHGLGDPMPTITKSGAGDLALLQAVINDGVIDVHLRMLHPKELAAAMGFPAGYQFSGKKTDIVRQIGNAVEVTIAEALVTSLMSKSPVRTLEVE